MDIKKRVYEAMDPAVRGRSYLAAVGRQDFDEASRLIALAPRGQGHGLPMLAAGQAIDAFAIFVLSALNEQRRASALKIAALAYCVGWAEAGGDHGDAKFLDQLQMVDELEAIVSQRRSELNATLVATFEWCEREGVSPMTMAGVLGIPLPLPKAAPGPVDQEILVAVRTVFDGIILG